MSTCAIVTAVPQRIPYLRHLVRQLHGLPVAVYMDGRLTGEPVPRTDDLLFAPNGPHGTQRFHEIWQRIVDSLDRVRFDYWIFLQDDVVLCRNFAARALDLFERTGADVLNLYRDHARGVTWNAWRSKVPVDREETVEVGWIDLVGFIAGPRFYERLQGVKFDPPLREGSTTSSVPFQMTRRFMLPEFGDPLDVRQSKKSYVFHLGLPSAMHAQLNRFQIDMGRTANWVDGDEEPTQAAFAYAMQALQMRNDPAVFMTDACVLVTRRLPDPGEIGCTITERSCQHCGLGMTAEVAGCGLYMAHESPGPDRGWCSAAVEAFVGFREGKSAPIEVWKALASADRPDAHSSWL